MRAPPHTDSLAAFWLWSLTLLCGCPPVAAVDAGADGGVFDGGLDAGPPDASDGGPCLGRRFTEGFRRYGLPALPGGTGLPTPLDPLDDTLLDRDGGPRDACCAGPDDRRGFVDDVTGDGWPDLVLTAGGPADQNVGTAVYRIYRGTPEAFDDGTEWMLPDLGAVGLGYGVDRFSRDAVHWRWIDLDDDGARELVVTFRAGTNVGTDHWEVFELTDGPPAMRTFAIPTPTPEHPARPSTGVRMALAPLVDGRTGLVITADPSDPSVGRDVWRVHRRDDNGFSPTVSLFTLPSGVGPLPALGLDATVRDPGRGSESPTWMLRDLSGDGRLDLVITADPDDETVGQTHWRVHRDVGRAFIDAAAAWSLPQLPGDPLRAYPSPDANLRWALLDLDGDGLVDLVVLDDAGAEVGVQYLLLYRNLGGGFAKNPFSFTMPSGPPGYRFSEGGYGLRDFSGDGRPDLVLYDDAQAETGVSTYKIYDNVCRWP